MKKNRNFSRQSRNDFDESFEKLINRKWSSKKNNAGCQKEKRGRVIMDTHDFKCRQCGAIVSADRALSGVNNRNHCPFCLWSRHVDHSTPGDRQAQCKSRMQPIGLTLKHTLKRNGMEKGGELMLVHCCTGCGKRSINRIAADDDPQAVYQIFRRSLDLGEKVVQQLNDEGILLLGARDLTIVYSQLYGWQSILEEFRISAEDGSQPVNTKGAVHIAVETS
jgi:hypothetical protein